MRFGFKFCKSHYFAVAAIDAVGVMVAVAVGVVPLSLTESSPWYVTVAIRLGLMVTWALTAIVLFRHGLMFWDSQAAAKKSGSARCQTTHTEGGPFSIAVGRLLPWIGFNLLTAAMVVLALLPFRLLIVVAGSSVWWLFVGIGLLGFALWVATMLSFVPIIAADGPGDPVTSSWRLVGANFWGTVGTFVLLALMNAAAGLVFLVLRAVVDAQWVLLVVAAAYSVAAQAVVIGTLVNMYRVGGRAVQMTVTPSRARSTSR